MTKPDRPKPTYWGRIPAEVRYDKSLPAAARLLYAEFDALSRKHGYCWASNSYFARLFEVDVATVSKWIKKLVDGDHISMRVVPKEANRRYIYLLTKKSIALLTEKSVAIDEKVKSPIDEKVKPTNKTSINSESEKQPPTPLFKKGSREDICWNSYLAAKSHFGTTFDPDFYDFFEQEVMGRFDKQKVCNATLSDWYNDVWMVYGIDDIVRVLKRQRDESNAWQVKWYQIKNRLRDDKKAKDNTELTRRQAEENKVNHAVDNKHRRQEQLELARSNLPEFVKHYQTNPFFRKKVDNDPELKRFMPEENKARTKRKCTISSDGKVTCTEKAVV
jgi:DNA-binding MarR family transcriptional regulator